MDSLLCSYCRFQNLISHCACYPESKWVMQNPSQKMVLDRSFLFKQILKIAKLQVPHSADNVACSPGGLAFLLILP